MILVTGGAGFIGANFVKNWLTGSDEPVLNFDQLTYAGNLYNVMDLAGDPRHFFVRGDICDSHHVLRLLNAHRPRAILHFAAETHVDRSIRSPAEFIATNINGTFSLLEAARSYWSALCGAEKDEFRFLNVSTDEVYGTLGPDDAPFCETTPYAPNSPYSASKAAADHLVRAYHHTYGFPSLTTNCSNNYGPYQFPEKLIPLMIANALAGKALPIYGDGQQVRNWLYVDDHCAAIRSVLAAGRVGEAYNIGGPNEMTNLEVVSTLCRVLDKLAPAMSGLSYANQIALVSDRPGHDRRYAVDSGKIQRELGWEPVEKFETGILKTVQWYLDNRQWVADIQSGTYSTLTEQDYLYQASKT